MPPGGETSEFPSETGRTLGGFRANVGNFNVIAHSSELAAPSFIRSVKGQFVYQAEGEKPVGSRKTKAPG